MMARSRVRMHVTAVLLLSIGLNKPFYTPEVISRRRLRANMADKSRYRAMKPCICLVAQRLPTSTVHTVFYLLLNPLRESGFEYVADDPKSITLLANVAYKFLLSRLVGDKFCKSDSIV